MSPLTVSQIPNVKYLNLQIVHEHVNANECDDKEESLNIVKAACNNKWEDTEEMDLLDNNFGRCAKRICTSPLIGQLWNSMQQFREMFSSTAMKMHARRKQFIGITLFAVFDVIIVVGITLAISCLRSLVNRS
mgnify:CR=1 FL=1